MIIKDFLKEFFNKPKLWGWVLVLIVAMTVHFGLFDNYNVTGGSVLFDLADSFSEGLIGQDITSSVLGTYTNDGMRKIPFWMVGNHLLPFSGWTVALMIEDTNIGQTTVAVDYIYGIAWLLVGFISIGLITRKSINALYAVGPFIALSVIVLILVTYLGPGVVEAAMFPDEPTTTTASPYIMLGSAEAQAWKEELVFSSRPVLISFFWSSIICGIIALVALRGAIKMKWLEGMDGSFLPLRFHMDTASADVWKAGTKAQKVLGDVSNSPMVAKVIERTTQAGQQLNQGLANMSSNSNNSQEIGSSVLFCPYCGQRKKFDGEGFCKNKFCGKQVLRIIRPTEGSECVHCGNLLLPSPSIEFCHICGVSIREHSCDVQPLADLHNEG